MIINTDDYETLKEMSERTGIPMNRLKSLKDFPKPSFIFNGNNYYLKGYSPIGKETKNKGKIPKERRLYRSIKANPITIRNFINFIADVNPNIWISRGKYCSFPKNSKGECTRTTYYNCTIAPMSSELEKFRHIDIPKEFGTKWLTRMNTIICDSSYDYYILRKSMKLSTLYYAGEDL